MGRRESIAAQLNQGGRRKSTYAPETEEEKVQLAGEIEDEVVDVVQPFETKFAPSDMRQLALVAHNHMKPAMKEFITTYSEILSKFRITGTQTTMKMCKALWGEDNPKIEYGVTCTSGPLGGDAQVAALMCMEDLGALIFFTDPLSAHPHQADIDSLIRLSNCGNIILCVNPTSAMSMMHVFKAALEKGSRGMIPSFFNTLESPAVPEYKHQQQLALASAVRSNGPPPAKLSALAAPDADNRVTFSLANQGPGAVELSPAEAAAEAAAQLGYPSDSDEEEDEEDDEEEEEDVVEEMMDVGGAPVKVLTEGTGHTAESFSDSDDVVEEVAFLAKTVNPTPLRGDSMRREQSKVLAGLVIPGKKKKKTSIVKAIGTNAKKLSRKLSIGT